MNPINTLKLDFNTLNGGEKFILTNFNCQPSQQLLKKKGFYKILWNQSSVAEIKIDGYAITLLKNQVLFCTPLNIVEIPLESGIVALVFNREFYCIRENDNEVSCHGFLFFGSSYPPIISLNKDDVKSIEATFQLIKEEFETQDNIQGEMLRTLLKRFLIKSTRILKHEKNLIELPKPEHDLVRQFHILVEQHFKDKHQVSDYADLLFKSPKTLANLFNKTGDKTPLEIINNRLALEAKRLLLYSDLNSEEIAYKLGYKDPSHFSRFFKKNVGSSPIEFRLSQ